MIFYGLQVWSRKYKALAKMNSTLMSQGDQRYSRGQFNILTRMLSAQTSKFYHLKYDFKPYPEIYLATHQQAKWNKLFDS